MHDSPADSRSPWRTLFDWALLVAPAVIALGLVLRITLSWRMRHDLPMMMYQAYLIDHFDLLPYRDFFDMNMPGSYLTYLFIGKTYGYGDLGMRLADFTTMAVLAATSSLMLRRFAVPVRVFGLACFLFLYLRIGGEITLQREYLALVPVSLAVAAAFSDEWSLRTRSLLTGLAFGLSATFKPHLVWGAIPVASFLVHEAWAGVPKSERRVMALRIVGWGAAAMATPAALVLLGLLAFGLLGEFLHGLGYLEFYARMAKNHYTHEGWQRLTYLVTMVLDLGGRNTAIFAGGLFGYFVCLSDPDTTDRQRRQAVTLAALAGFYLVYPAFSGQFWPYHWLPGQFFCAVGLGMLVLPTQQSLPGWLLPRLFAFVLLIQVSDAHHGLRDFSGAKETRPESGRADAVAKVLKRNLQPGDTVQAFDWVMGGMAHAELLAQARPATRFLYTFHFYHHADEPYIQGLRERFIAELEAHPPAFIADSRYHWPYAKGPKATSSFPAYEAFVSKHYEKLQEGPNWTVRVRRDHPAAAQ